jgi:hypothetical protein
MTHEFAVLLSWMRTLIVTLTPLTRCGCIMHFISSAQHDGVGVGIEISKQIILCLFGTATRLRAGRPGFDSRQGLGILLIATASRPALRLTQPHIQGVPGIISLGVKRPVREADHSPPYSAEVKNEWSYTSTPSIRLYGVVLS